MATPGIFINSGMNWDNNAKKSAISKDNTMNSIERICSIGTFSGSFSVNHFTCAFAIIGEKQNNPNNSIESHFFNRYTPPICNNA